MRTPLVGKKIKPRAGLSNSAGCCNILAGATSTVGGWPLPAKGGGADGYIRSAFFVLSVDREHYRTLRLDKKEITAWPGKQAVNS